MTLGITGVVWLPRTATVNSSTLIAGAGPVPLSAAATAWTNLAASYTDTAATLSRVMAELVPTWEGGTASAAQSRLAAFLAWTHSTVELAAETATKAGGQAAAYTTAALVMPSLPEIAVVKTTKAAAYGSGGALNGSAQAAELADTALDVRAALVMEAYEAATSVLAVRCVVDPPPQITVAVGAGAGTGVTAATTYSDAEHDVDTHPESARTTPAAALLDARTPAAVQSAVTQTANVGSSSASSLVSAVSGMGSSALSSGDSGMRSPLAAATFAAAPSAASTSAASLVGGGSPGSGGFAAGRTRGTFSPGPSLTTGVDSASTGSTIGAPDSLGQSRTGGSAMPMSRGHTDDDQEIRTQFADRITHVSDGIAVIPPVIGSDPDV